MASRGTASTPDRGATLAEEFERAYGFSFDDFQSKACAALAQGFSVLVAAPTGAGKTVVGEFAAHLALRGGGRTFYTTPIKALSNQKYGDFVALHGAANVGLLTGDNSLNGDAPVVVMTTEVLRNMIYEDSSALADLRYVVLDEVHYLQDRYRGAVWEEILIHLPVDVLTVSLSATVSNTEEFAQWLKTLRGEVEVVIEEKRPVDIRHEYMVADELMPMFARAEDGSPLPNPRARNFERKAKRNAPRPGRGGRRPRERRARPPLRIDVVRRLRQERMLPAIYFIFSRRGCDDAVRQMMRENVRLTSTLERERIVAFAGERVGELTPVELEVLGYYEWIEALSRGVAAHHAGMVPPFKETVEELFKQGLVRVVFATETLALGINMPARTVVVESLMKFTGEKHELITAGQYTQLSGRAGRRGIDELGHSVVLMQRYANFDSITRLASTRSYPLDSSFQPSYNMAVNLVRNYDRKEAEHLVNSSFAQFQADREVVTLEQSRERLGAYLASYQEKMLCEKGDIEEYRNLLDELSAARRGSSGRQREVTGRAPDAAAALRPGDVFVVPSGRRRGRYAVIEVSQRKSERRPRILALGEDRSLARFSAGELRGAPRAHGRIPIPKGWQVRDARDRRQLARRLAAFDLAAHEGEDVGAGGRGGHEPRGDDARFVASSRAVEEHPCHGCPEIGRHLHWADRAARLQRELAGIDRRVGRRSGTLARRFEKVLGVLEDRDFLGGWELTAKGRMLAEVYNELDLLVVEILQDGLLDGLTAPEVAAVCSTLVYQPRGPEIHEPAELPTGPAATVWRRVMDLWRAIRISEDLHGIELTREPDPGFALTAFDWAAGADLDAVLAADDAAGDFVRSVKQLIDLLRQLEEVAADKQLRKTVGQAIAGLQRSVVDYSSVEA